MDKIEPQHRRRENSLTKEARLLLQATATVKEFEIEWFKKSLEELDHGATTQALGKDQFS